MIISTGKSDWVHEVTSESGSLASYLESASGSTPKVKKDKSEKGGKETRGGGGAEGSGKNDSDKQHKEKKRDAGVFDSHSQTRVSILNGSHHTVCDDNKRETILLFPDYKVITEVERSREGAERLWRVAVNPSVGRAGVHVDKEDNPIRSWVLPYSCVILLCRYIFSHSTKRPDRTQVLTIQLLQILGSHKRRDNRCGLSAPKLEAGFTTALEREGWEVHRQLEDPDHYGPPLEELTGTDEEREAEIVRQLKSLESDTVEEKKALIIRNSHIGGHKFAGNCIVSALRAFYIGNLLIAYILPEQIYTPQGAAVWYGRVTPHNVDPIVKETIIDGKVLPTFLRGGLNISQPGHENLHQW